ncbi:hypothetical protein [Glycomyces sp. NPDC047010]|uniref:hypothetical protein n=1 Tax=Glycomyces sp. NPDC047010 TaxID=3155023 RepID=UPI0033E95C4D
MSDNRFDVDIEAVLDAAAHLRSVRGDFDEVAGYTADADPDWWMLGVQGLAWAQQYELSADRIRTILNKYGPATGVEKDTDGDLWASAGSGQWSSGVVKRPVLVGWWTRSSSCMVKRCPCAVAAAV